MSDDLAYAVYFGGMAAAGGALFAYGLYLRSRIERLDRLEQEEARERSCGVRPQDRSEDA